MQKQFESFSNRCAVLGHNREVARDLFPRLIDRCVLREGGGFPEARWREPPGNTPLEVYAAVE